MRMSNYNNRRRYDRRPLTEDDLQSWQDAVTKRPTGKAKTEEDVKALIRNRNPVRWWQLQRDFKWVQKEMKKMGLNPEDARFLL